VGFQLCFAEGDRVKGDVNLDGAIVQKVTLTAIQIAHADMNGDGLVNILDAVRLVNLILGK
jgi:hypothetical protein